MSYLAHEGHTHGTVLTFSANEAFVLLVLAVLAFVLHGDNPARAGSTTDLSVRNTLRPIGAGVAGLGIVLPALMWVAHALGLSIKSAQMPAFLAVGVVATAVAHLAHRPRPWLVGALGLLGYYVAYQLSMVISSSGGGPATALAAMTLFSVALPAVPWAGQAVRVVALVGCWAAMSVLSTQPWSTIRTDAVLAALVAAAASLIPFALTRADAARHIPPQRAGPGRHDVPAERLST